jgi:hypothetical protein
LSGRLDAGGVPMRKANELSPFATGRIFYPDNTDKPAHVAQMQRIIGALRAAGLPDRDQLWPERWLLACGVRPTPAGVGRG